jgi:hypothetical protein
VIVALVRLHEDPPVLVALTAVLIFAVRMLALRRRWQAPTPGHPATEEERAPTAVARATPRGAVGKAEDRTG